MQNSASSVIDTAQLTTYRLNQSSVAFLKLELLCHKHFPCICPGKGMGSVPVISFDVEHDLINQFLL